MVAGVVILQYKILDRSRETTAEAAAVKAAEAIEALICLQDRCAGWLCYPKSIAKEKKNSRFE